MTLSKKLGIWIDHSNAHLIELTTEPLVTKNIALDFTYEDKHESIHRTEKQMHNREQHQQYEYYKKIGVIIRNYDDVLLFGPTEAKTELYNILKEDHLFANIKFEIKNTDKLTENQQHAFVREHFKR